MSCVVLCEILKEGNYIISFVRLSFYNFTNIQFGLALRQTEKSPITRFTQWEVLHDVGVMPRRPFPEYVVSGGSSKVESAVDLQLCRLVGLKSKGADKSAVCCKSKVRKVNGLDILESTCVLTRTQIYEVGDVQVLVVHKCCVHPRAGSVIYAKVIHLTISPE